MYKIWAILLLCFASFSAQAQYDTASIFNVPIQMDTVVITAARSGWDVQAFIRRIQTDTTFYKAFKSMNLVPYTATNDIRVYGKDNNIIASYYSITKQIRKNNCRSMQVVQQKTTGDFYKRNGDYRYYTAELYAYLFFTKGTVCNENDIVAGYLNERGQGSIEKSIYQLKQLIFNPGSKVSGVPLMGDKASVFDADQAPKYDFKLLSDTYDGQDCYVFKVTPKAGYEHDVVFNELTTWFRKSDYSIVARNYSLSYSTLLYDFNVSIQVRTQQIGNKLLPVSMDYDGNWHVISKKREHVKFSTRITY